MISMLFFNSLFSFYPIERIVKIYPVKDSDKFGSFNFSDTENKSMNIFGFVTSSSKSSEISPELKSK